MIQSMMELILCGRVQKYTKEAQPNDKYEYEEKVPNKFAARYQNETERDQVLHDSAMCLHPRAVKQANASNNKSNECSEELQMSIF